MKESDRSSLNSDDCIDCGNSNSEIIDSNNDVLALKKNAVMNTIMTVSSLLFPLVTYPYAARILTPVGIGKVSFATSLISYFSIIAQLGIPVYGIRACARVRDNQDELSRVTHELLFINLIMSVFAYAGLTIAIALVPRLQEERILLILISSSILLSSIGVEWLYKALEKYTYITIRSILFKLIALCGLFLLVHKKEDYIMYGIITIFASSASSILNFMNIHKYVHFRYIGHYNLRRHLKAIVTFFAMACAVTIYTNLDIIMLGFMRTDADVGYYNAAIKVKQILLGIVTSIGAVLLPRSSYYIEKGRLDEFKKVSCKALRFVMFSSVPAALFFGIFAEDVVLVLSGKAYVPAILPMQFIIPTVLFIGITNIFGIQMLVPMGKEKHVLFSEIIGATIDLILNFFLIPSYGALGASIGTLAAELSVLLYQLYVIMKEQLIVPMKQSIVRYSSVALISALPCVFIKHYHLTSFERLCLSGFLFFCLYWGLLYIMKDETIELLINRD